MGNEIAIRLPDGVHKQDCLEFFISLVGPIKFSVSAIIKIIKQGIVCAEYEVGPGNIDYIKFYTSLSDDELILGISAVSVVISSSEYSNPIEITAALVTQAQMRIIPMEELEKFKFLHQVKSELRATQSGDEILEGGRFVLKVLSSAIRERRPFSLVRLGDGEGRIFGYPHLFCMNDIVRECLGYQFGPQVFEDLQNYFGEAWEQKAIAKLQSILRYAVESADVVCAPTYRHYLSKITSDNLNSLVGQAASWSIARIAQKPKNIVIDTFIFYDLHRLDKLRHVLSLAQEICVVSHSDATAAVANHLGVTAISHLRVPSHQTFMPSTTHHFPEHYLEIAKNLKEKSKRGKVFLVCAGYLGKFYCAEVKAAGGIAIDIGSLFDAWTGEGRKDAVENTDLRIV